MVSADYPGINVKDILSELELKKIPKSDQVGDTKLILGVLRGETPDARFDWVTAHTDAANNALIGHSAGAMAVGELGGQAKLHVAMAGHGVVPAPKGAPHQSFSVLLLGGQNDTIVGLHNQESGFLDKSTPEPKRLAAVDRLGHHFCDDICAIGAAKGGIAGIAKAHGIWQAGMIGKLADNGCRFENDAFDAPSKGWTFVNYATTLMLEGVLKGNTAAMKAGMAAIAERLDDVFEYKEAL